MTAGAAPDPVDQAQRLFAAAAAITAPRLTAVADAEERVLINERHYLQPQFKAALQEVAAEADPAPAVSPSLSHGLKAHWPRLGTFDISLQRAGGQAVYGELKCDATLTACAWDAVKCAFALRHGVGAGMLLVAAATQSVWEQRGLGSELFDNGEWLTSDVRHRHQAGFKFWELEGYRPVRVPDRLRTTAICRVPFSIGGFPWLLAISRVEPVGDGWYDWPPFLTGPPQ